MGVQGLVIRCAQLPVTEVAGLDVSMRVQVNADINAGVIAGGVVYHVREVVILSARLPA